MNNDRVETTSVIRVYEFNGKELGPGLEPQAKLRVTTVWPGTEKVELEFDGRSIVIVKDDLLEALRRT